MQAHTKRAQRETSADTRKRQMQERTEKHLREIPRCILPRRASVHPRVHLTFQWTEGRYFRFHRENSRKRIFFFGNGPKEEEIVNNWCTKYPRTTSFIGKSNFNGELRFISHLDVMLCMDSANMHIASLAGTPAISIWGATSPLAGFLGWKQRTEDCIELPLECRPCSIFGNKPCRYGDYRCMDIEPETISEKVAQRIGLV